MAHKSSKSESYMYHDITIAGIHWEEFKHWDLLIWDWLAGEIFFSSHNWRNNIIGQ